MLSIFYLLSQNILREMEVLRLYVAEIDTVPVLEGGGTLQPDGEKL